MPKTFRKDRCCNPFDLKNHYKSTGLRRASQYLCQKWNLNESVSVCTLCRIKLKNQKPVVAVAKPIDADISSSRTDDANSENLISDNENLENDDDNKCDIIEAEAMRFESSDSFPSQQINPSQVSIDSRLPVINEALQLLDESPIQKHKLKSESWICSKVEKISHNIRNSLGLGNEHVLNTQNDAEDLHRIISTLKEKLHHEETSKTEKIQILTVLPMHWSIGKISQMMDVTKYMVRVAKKLAAVDGILSVPGSNSGKRISEQTRTEVTQFYIDDRVSMMLPGKKDYVSVRNNDNQRTQLQKRLILANLKEIFAFFRSEHPDTKIGFSLFASMRPKQCVLAGASGTHTVCVCALHQNVKLLMIGSHLASLTSDAEHHLNHYNDCLNLIICPNPMPACYFGSCPNCPGTAPLYDIIEKTLDENEIETVTYKHWVCDPRATLETAVKDTSEFVEEFCNQVKRLLPHSFIAKEQASFMKILKESLKNEEVLIVSDFAENYAFVVQNAAPGFHWNNNQATVYPVVVYFKSNDVITHKSLVIISDCLAHDSVAVYVFSKIVMEFVESINNEVLKVYYFSDGAPQQFKNFKNFVNLYYHELDFGIKAEWHFFATAHGKGPCDGIGGTLKRMAARASLQLPPDRQITTPKKLFEWASLPTSLPNIAVKFSSKIHYVEAKTFLEKRFKKAKRIPGTQKLHCIIPQANGRVATKLFSRQGESKEYTIEKNTVPEKNV